MDDTFSLLKGEAIRRIHIKVVRLRKNFSQTAALSAGFDLAEGDTIENLARYIIRASFYKEYLTYLTAESAMTLPFLCTFQSVNFQNDLFRIVVRREKSYLDTVRQPNYWSEQITHLAASYEVWNGINAVVSNYHGSMNR